MKYQVKLKGRTLKFKNETAYNNWALSLNHEDFNNHKVETIKPKQEIPNNIIHVDFINKCRKVG